MKKLELVFDTRHKFCPSCGIVQIYGFSPDLPQPKLPPGTYLSDYDIACTNCRKTFRVQEYGYR